MEDVSTHFEAAHPVDEALGCMVPVVVASLFAVGITVTVVDLLFKLF